jgi:hypothetical protein
MLREKVAKPYSWGATVWALQGSGFPISSFPVDSTLQARPFGEDAGYTSASRQYYQGTRVGLGSDYGSTTAQKTIGNSNYNALEITFSSESLETCHSAGRLHVFQVHRRCLESGRTDRSVQLRLDTRDLVLGHDSTSSRLTPMHFPSTGSFTATASPEDGVFQAQRALQVDFQ